MELSSLNGALAVNVTYSTGQVLFVITILESFRGLRKFSGGRFIGGRRLLLSSRQDAKFAKFGIFFFAPLREKSPFVSSFENLGGVGILGHHSTLTALR